LFLKQFSTHTLTSIFSRCFAGTGNVNGTDTWRKEYKTRTFASCHYFFQLPRDVSARATCTSRVQKNSVIQDITLEKNVPYSAFENTFFPYQTRDLTIR
jgi:hypothetical protein